MASRNQYTYTPGYQGAGRQIQTRNAAIRQAPRQGAARRPAAQAKRRPAGDTLILTLLFIVAPLCGILGLFIKTLLWVFVGVALLVLAAMWALRCFEPRGRAFLSGILLVLTAVALIAVIDVSPQQTYFPSYGNDPVLSSQANLGGTVGSQGSQSDLNTQTNQNNQDDQNNQNNQNYQNNPAFVGLTGMNPTPTAPLPAVGAGEDGATPAATDGVTGDGLTGDGTQDGTSMGQPKTVTSAAQEVMEKYMRLWQEQNFEDMVALTTPEWQNAQKVPQRQLSWAHSGWFVNSWSIVPEVQSPDADSVTLTVLADLTKNVSSKPQVTYQYSALILNKNGTWYVDPDSMRNGVPPAATQPPSTGGDGNAGTGPTVAPSPTTDPSLKLWYNTSGGQMYHLEQKCSSINERNHKYMQSFKYSELENTDYARLKPCSVCGAPSRP